MSRNSPHYAGFLHFPQTEFDGSLATREFHNSIVTTGLEVYVSNVSRNRLSVGLGFANEQPIRRMQEA